MCARKITSRVSARAASTAKTPHLGRSSLQLRRSETYNFPVSLRSQPAAPKARVLVIDDDEIALQAISDVLEAAGYQVHSMVSPIGATQIIAGSDIQAAVIDLNMPLMSGDRLIALIRSWDRIRDLPVVLISGSSAKILDQMGSQLPGVRVVTKDAMRLQLPSALSDALNARVPPRQESSGNTQRLLRGEVLNEFLKTLPTQAHKTLALFHALGQGSSDPRPVIAAITNLRTQSQISGLAPITQLLAVLGDVVELHGALPSVAVQSSVAAALTFVAGLNQEKGGAAAISMKAGPYLARLERLVEQPPR
jgi:CheY-like chemotaxis protein